MENPSRQVNEICFFVFVFFAALTQESVQQQVYTSTAPLQAHDKLTVLAGATLYIPKGVDVDRSWRHFLKTNDRAAGMGLTLNVLDATLRNQ